MVEELLGEMSELRVPPVDIARAGTGEETRRRPSYRAGGEWRTTRHLASSIVLQLDVRFGSGALRSAIESSQKTIPERFVEWTAIEGRPRGRGAVRSSALATARTSRFSGSLRRTSLRIWKKWRGGRTRTRELDEAIRGMLESCGIILFLEGTPPAGTKENTLVDSSPHVSTMRWFGKIAM
ncbi:hypothetical protein KM043_000427 [Ampulex compressa]|nr:hypothetical protein KM043_000427 [Ampulex compressa]